MKTEEWLLVTCHHFNLGEVIRKGAANSFRELEGQERPQQRDGAKYEEGKGGEGEGGKQDGQLGCYDGT